MISEKQKTKISKFLSLVLRHKPETIGIDLDENGWVSVKDLIKKSDEYGIRFNLEILKDIVETNNKKRFAFNQSIDRIRASQGHSIEVELGYSNKQPPEFLFHGTALKYVESILENGLQKRNRQHVHLTHEIETALKVGQRHGKPYIFKVLATKMHKEKHEFFLSENGVWLTEFVPIQYLEKND